MNVYVDCSIHCRRWFTLYKICLKLSTLVPKSKEIVTSEIVTARWQIEIYLSQARVFCSLCYMHVVSHYVVTSLLSLYSTNNINTKEFSRITALSLLRQIAYSFLSIRSLLFVTISENEILIINFPVKMAHRIKCRNYYWFDHYRNLTIR